MIARDTKKIAYAIKVTSDNIRAYNNSLISILTMTTMRKLNLICLLLMLGVVLTSNSQTTAPADFFAGKWEVTVIGTPNGDSKMIIDLVRTDGKLTGQMSNPTEPSAEKVPVTVDESADLLDLAFNAQGYDVTINLKKVDDDNLKGSLLGMFDAIAKRVK